MLAYWPFMANTGGGSALNGNAGESAFRSEKNDGRVGEGSCVGTAAMTPLALIAPSIEDAVDGPFQGHLGVEPEYPDQARLYRVDRDGQSDGVVYPDVT